MFTNRENYGWKENERKTKQQHQQTKKQKEKQWFNNIRTERGTRYIIVLKNLQIVNHPVDKACFWTKTKCADNTRLNDGSLYLLSDLRFGSKIRSFFGFKSAFSML